MDIKKLEDGTLKLRLTGFDVSLDSILNDEELINNDLYFKFASGELWLLDYNKNLAYFISGYFHRTRWGYVPFFRDLLDGRDYVKLTPEGDLESVAHYFDEDIL